MIQLYKVSVAAAVNLNIAKGETTQAITNFHVFDNFNFFGFLLQDVFDFHFYLNL